MKISGSDWNTQNAAQMQQDFFKKLDQDGDGKVTKDELKAGLSAKSGGATAPAGAPNIDDIFSKIDTNGDGSIDESENSAFMQSMATKHHHHGSHKQGQGTEGVAGATGYDQTGAVSVTTPATSKTTLGTA